MQGPERRPLLIVAHGYQKQGRAITVAVAEDLSEINTGLRHFRLIHGAISLGILIALLGLQYFIVTHALKPLRRVKADMQRLERGEIEQIKLQGPQEILSLISELNRLLAAMGKKMRRSREATGNLAHALKTQLALLNQAIERSDGQLHVELQSQMREIGERMRGIVERELKRARLLGSGLPGKRINLRQDIDALVQTLQAMYGDKSPVIALQIADAAAFMGDREDMLELLGNLLDNACKWCRERVQLKVDAISGLVLVVEDDGPGCEAGVLGELTRRGFRVDESQPGSGLGLAIAQDIAESYDGTISLDRSPALGGLRIEVRLPDARMANSADSK
jgi:signal transduction histidine kinase